MNSNPSTLDAPPTEDAWVQAQLVGSLMRVSGPMQIAIWLVIPIFVGLMWGHVDDVGLMVWVGAAVILAVLRELLLHHYRRTVSQAPPAAQLSFFERTRPIHTATAVVWGFAVALFFDRSALASQFVCWLILAVTTLLAVNALSSHLPTLRSYVHVLMGVACAVVLWRVVIEYRLQGPLYHYWLLAVLLVFWQVLYQTGRRQHLIHRRQYELQYRNNQLIESLTHQTQTALDAVEIKNRFLASAAHDIRQPVLALGLYADWLSSEPELVHEIAPKILESTRAVNALFDSLFDLVRLDSGQVRLHLEPVELDKLLGELQVQYQPLAQARGLQWRVRRSGSSVVSDAVLLARILGNLVSNAIKYTDRGGVLLAVRGSGRRLRIEVWDTGLGIAPQHQQDIFREFFKVPAHSGTQDGFGLGLYIVSRLAHILGYPVELASRPGRGTVFRLLLEPTDPQEAAARAASISQLPRRP